MGAHPDAVERLPGWEGPLPSAMFSGFIPVERDGKTAQWHYTLSESEAPLDPSDAPLVLYVSGGPGGSSFQTSFRGFGQFRLDDRSVAAADKDGVPQLFHHEYAWTKAANVLSWESPPGVGFSFCPDPADAVWDDETVAVHSADFLEGVVARHPSLSGRQFVVFGASYAGVYIPMLAEEILKRPDFPLSLAAIGVGNAAIGHFPGWNFPEGGQTLTSHDVPNDTASHVDFYFYSGLFSQSLYAESEDTNGRKISPGSGSDAELWVLAVQDACGGDRSALDFPDEEMQGLLRQMQREMGPMHVRVTLQLCTFVGL